MKKVSVIIPVYNAKDNITKCIESIINSTYKEIELLLINDGSSDDSIKILKEYEEKYGFIKVIDKKNEGVAKTRNLGIKEAIGEYIMFIDNDDYIDNDYIEKYIEDIEDYDVVVGGFRRVDVAGKKLYERKLTDTYWSRYNIITPWAKIYKKEFLIKNKIEFFSYPIGEDVYFNILLYSKKPKVKIIEYIGYNWLDNSNSVSNTTHKGLDSKVDILLLLDKINKVNKNNDIYIKYYIKKFYVWYLLYSGKYASSDNFLKENEKIKKWLKENSCTKTISPFSRKLKGESLKNRLAVFIFLTLDKIHLLGLFAKIYCKGE